MPNRTTANGMTARVAHTNRMPPSYPVAGYGRIEGDARQRPETPGRAGPTPSTGVPGVAAPEWAWGVLERGGCDARGMTARTGAARARGALSRATGRLRPLVVLAVVAGVLTMHALTVGHHPAPAASSALTTSASAVSLGVAMRDLGLHAGGVAAGTTEMRAVGRHAADGCTGCGQGGPGSSHTGTHLLDVCLGVLLAFALLSLLTRRTRAGSIVNGPATWWQARLSVSRRPRPPSLSQLCVLRT